ncbi:MAG: hypothetical protein ACK550_18205 [Synechococcaceae cyanobacterium]
MRAAGAKSVSGAAMAESAAASPRRDASRQPKGRGCGEAVPPLSFSACKEQQLVLLLVRQLGSAQFALAHGPMTQRLWDEVAALGIDPERVTHLLYGGQDPNDRLGLQALDNAWLEAHRPAVGGWLRQITGAAWRRGAPPAGPRAHR